MILGKLILAKAQLSSFSVSKKLFGEFFRKKWTNEYHPPIGPNYLSNIFYFSLKK
jgi:hypothetical protein